MRELSNFNHGIIPKYYECGKLVYYLIDIMHEILIHNITSPAKIPIYAKICKSYLSRLRGLMFQNTISENEGLLFVNNRENRFNTSIHMLFMNFNLAIIWVNSQKIVVDTQLVKRWSFINIPKANAKYIIETNVIRLSDFHTNDELAFENL